MCALGGGANSGQKGMDRWCIVATAAWADARQCGPSQSGVHLHDGGARRATCCLVAELLCARLLEMVEQLERVRVQKLTQPRGAQMSHELSLKRAHVRLLDFTHAHSSSPRFLLKQQAQQHEQQRM